MNKQGLLSLIKFGLVGVLNTAIDFTVFALLTSVSAPYLAAQVAGYSCGVANSYLLNRSWTFRSDRKDQSQEIIKFIVLNLITLAVVSGLLALLTTYTGWHLYICKMIATLVGVLLNYGGSRYLVFNSKTMNRSDVI